MIESFDSTPAGIGFRFVSSYIIYSPASREASVIDPGPLPRGDELSRRLLQLKPRIVAIVLTHIHLDHASSTGLIARELSDKGVKVEVLVHPRGVKHIVSPGKLWSASLEALGETAYIYGYPYPVDESIVRSTSDGEKLRLEGFTISFIHTPGHASHHQAVVLECDGLRVVFTGDAAGIYVSETGGVIPTTPPPFHADKYLKSLDRIANINFDLLAPTHNSLAPPELLEVHRVQIEKWLKTAAERSWSSASEYLKYMLSTDSLAARAYMLLSRSRHTSVTVIHTAEGILSALHR